MIALGDQIIELTEQMNLKVSDLESVKVNVPGVGRQNSSGLALLHDAHVTVTFERRANETVADHAVLYRHMSRLVSESLQRADLPRLGQQNGVCGRSHRLGVASTPRWR